MDALEHMASYMRFLNDILLNKRKLEEYEMVPLIEDCNVILQKKLLIKLKDLGSSIIPCSIRNSLFEKALYDLHASINCIPLSIFRKA